MERTNDERSTRRRFLAAGAGVATFGLAGCTGNADRTTTEATTETTDGDAAGTTADAATTTADSGPYTVTMAPMGDVEFESVPETWMAYFSTYGDMGIALGQLDGLRGLIFAENWPLQFYDYLPGVDVSFDGVRQLHAEGGIAKEAFYELDCDVHLMDPNFIARLDDSWSRSDFAEIATNVGPIVGNYIRRDDEPWHDYRYYSLYEAFEKVAAVFRERERYEALAAVHDEFVATLESKLPPASERPEIGLLSINSQFEKGSFYAYPIGTGNGKKQYQDLRVRDAFGPHIDGGYAEWDYEALLEVDPDVLVFSYGFSHATRAEFDEKIELMADHPIGSQLSAVKNDRLYRGGSSYQGPVLNLLQTEAAAKQFYPDVFGEWRGLETLAAKGEQLFDHAHVADVIRGNF